MFNVKGFYKSSVKVKKEKKTINQKYISSFFFHLEDIIFDFRNLFKPAVIIQSTFYKSIEQRNLKKIIKKCIDNQKQ